MEKEPNLYFSEDLKHHREFLQSQLNQVKWGVTTLVVVAGTLIFFMVGRSTSDINDFAKAQISEQIINYNLKTELQEELKNRVSLVVEQEVENTKKVIQEQVGKAVQSILSNKENIRGPKGDPGPRGEPGARGETGKNGVKGDRGAPGFNGKSGRDGKDGTFANLPKAEEVGKILVAARKNKNVTVKFSASAGNEVINVVYLPGRSFNFTSINQTESSNEFQYEFTSIDKRFLLRAIAYLKIKGTSVVVPYSYEIIISP